MIEKITNYLKKKEWTFTLSDKDKNVLYFPVNGFNATFHCAVDITEKNSFFLFITFSGTSCPTDKRLILAELFNRINFRIRYGNFEVGMETGEIKFRTCICYEGMEINDIIIDNVILKNIFIHDYAFPLISKFLFGDMTMAEVTDNMVAPTEIENNEPEVIESKILE